MRQHASVAMALALALALSPTMALAAGGVKLGYDDKTRIVAKGQPVYPEGIAYDPVGKRIFVGSTRLGHLFTVNGRYPGLRSGRVVAVEVVPVAAPTLVAQFGAPTPPAELTRWPHVHDAERKGWHLWFQAQGLDEIGPPRGAPPSMIPA